MWKVGETFFSSRVQKNIGQKTGIKKFIKKIDHSNVFLKINISRKSEKLKKKSNYRDFPKFLANSRRDERSRNILKFVRITYKYMSSLFLSRVHEHFQFPCKITLVLKTEWFRVVYHINSINISDISIKSIISLFHL